MRVSRSINQLLTPARSTHSLYNDWMQKSLRIVTWNIHKGVRGFALRKRLEIHAMQDAVAKLDADLICLQEVRRINHKEAAHFTHWPELPQADFLAPAGYHAVYRTNAFTAHGEHGNALLSRYPVKRIGHEDMSDHRFEQRGLLHAVLDVMGQDLHVIVVHLGLLAGGRARQLAQIGAYILREIPLRAPVVVAGDFNSAIASQRWAHAYLQASDSSKKAMGRLHALKGHPTFPSRLPLVQLDHIFARRAKISQQHAPVEPHWARMSDHLPLIAQLELPQLKV
jgi:endonuclease/exonuclease/phosphatase family metal-dependent hydrolase